MGANHLQGMCLTVGVRSYLGKSLSHPLIRGAWRHNLACALVAEQLAAAGFMNKDQAYTSGVLHDVGRLALAVIRPEAYANMLVTHQGSGASILCLETQLFGCNHCEAGKHLVSSWQLPSGLDTVIAEHHEPRRTDGAWSMAELVKISCRLADTAGFPAFPGCAIAPFGELRDQLPERERGAFHSELETLTRELTQKIEAIEAL
jgi:HD-like signal output (HDOD) protein